MYPSIAMAMNISRETKYATVLWVEGCPHTLEEIDSINNELDMLKEENSPESIKKFKLLKKKLEGVVLENTHYLDELFGKLATPDENAVDICHDLFNFPDYSTMLQLYEIS